MGVMYKNSGVDLEQAEKLSAKLKNFGENFNAFSGEIIFGKLKILNSCDGIGTKVVPLYENAMYKTIAIDLAAANLNDLATKNARAFSFLDYIAVNKLDSNAVYCIIWELKEVLNNYDCALLGGETSEMPDIINKIDICGFVTGIADKDFVPEKINSGDVIIGLKSNGIHANGFSLIRKLHQENRLSEEDFSECLKPSFIYYDSICKLWSENLIKSAANITGGGIYANLKRCFPEKLEPELNFSAIPLQKIYEKLYKLCGEEIYDVFNCGVGFCVVAGQQNKKKIFDICKKFEPFILGKVVGK